MPNSVVFVVGTRPEAIKLAPVAAALAERGLPPLLIFTGQHPLPRPADYRLDPYPDVRLDCRGRDNPHLHVEAVTRAVAPVLAGIRPELVVVQGDTSSAFGGALAAALAGICLAHVEAGLRSHDRRFPWPEEEFRVAIDANSQLLFAPTELSAANLRRERVRGTIHVTGNTGIDAVLGLNAPAAPPHDGPPRLLVTCHRRENWGDGIVGVAAAIRSIAAQDIAQVEIILHPNPALSHRLRTLLLGQSGIAFRPPCGHRDAIAAMLGSDLILSDSGGMQEEAAALGVPLLILREKTERPEAIACGSLKLIGTDPGIILTAVKQRLHRSRPAPSLPFGDGRAGQRIAAIVEEWLEPSRARSPPSVGPVSRAS
ncbi:MAG TPA: UDP-N-acetylglucosamine 2-epimerase (non-hydrolyzing) [Sphingomicrobium sp.]|nr:UDP-N-acetylglucosamine 2-epimerase (non-hydrolyzing) [Sphingomicrobium sp.]